jgi:hypothetical protein
LRKQLFGARLPAHAGQLGLAAVAATAPPKFAIAQTYPAAEDGDVYFFFFLVCVPSLTPSRIAF